MTDIVERIGAVIGVEVGFVVSAMTATAFERHAADCAEGRHVDRDSSLRQDCQREISESPEPSRDGETRKEAKSRPAQSPGSRRGYES